jgi:hypothetical protein
MGTEQKPFVPQRYLCIESNATHFFAFLVFQNHLRPLSTHLEPAMDETVSLNTTS